MIGNHRQCGQKHWRLDDIVPLQGVEHPEHPVALHLLRTCHRSQARVPGQQNVASRLRKRQCKRIGKRESTRTDVSETRKVAIVGFPLRWLVEAFDDLAYGLLQQL